MTADEVRLMRNRAVDARRRKRNALAKLRGESTGLIDAAGVRAKTKTLLELGWSYEGIVHMAGGHGTAAGLRLIANGTSRKIERKFAAVADLPVTLEVADAVPDACFVPSLGATRRVRALMAIGWRHEDITEFIVRASHHLSSGRHPKMLAADWRLVDAAYERLCATPGGSNKTLTRARKAGYPPPLAWNNIDDPNETPTDWEYRPATRHETLADLIDRGDSITTACRVLKLSRQSLHKWCSLHGLQGAYRTLVERERSDAFVTWNEEAS